MRSTRSGTEDVRQGYGNVWESERCEMSVRHLPALVKALLAGAAEQLNLALGEIDDPGFGDAGGGVERHLRLAVEVQRRVGHLDEQKNIPRPWVGPGIKVLAWHWQQEGKIGLRLGQVAKPQGVLGADGRAPSRQDREHGDE